MDTAGEYGRVCEQHTASVCLKLAQLVGDVGQQWSRGGELLQLQGLRDAVRLVPTAARELGPARRPASADTDSSWSERRRPIC